MKIKLLTLAVIAAGVLAIGSANAADDPVWQAEATCVGGNLGTDKNGHEYCLSNSNMNWWSAYTWCQGQGRHLASIYEACPGWDGSQGVGKCVNSNNKFSTAWTSTPSQGSKAFRVSIYSRVEDQVRTSTSNALCY